MNLQGYTAIDGAIQPSLGDIRVKLGVLAQKATENITMTANLDADADYSTTPVASMSLNGSTETIADVTAAADFSSSVVVYDTLGDRHEFTLAYEKTGINTWTAYVVTDGGDVYDQEFRYNTHRGFCFKVASIDLTFDTDGSLINFAQTNTSAISPWNFEGADDMDFNFLLGLDASGNEVDGDLSQLASSYCNKY